MHKLLTLVLCSLWLVPIAGCELIADFDRSKIPVSDAGSPPDAAVHKDAAVSDDAGEEDAGDFAELPSP
jgi:hypothetical protein